MIKTKAKKIDEPLVSVIIPVYNCEQYINTAVKSIVEQSYKNLEIIIIDDGSTDSTWDILTELKRHDKRIVTYRNKENLKIVGTLNLGIEKSNGIYIARMDGDDYREVDSIKQQVSYLEGHSDIVIVGGAIDVCDSEMNVINHRQYPADDSEIRAKIFRYNPFAHPAVVMRKSALVDTPYLLNWAEDYDLYFRLGNKGKFANLPATVLKLRTHPSSISQSKVSYQEYLTLYIRLKAVFEYGYTMTIGDKIYFFLQLVSKWLMPIRFRFWLFNKIRAIKA
ncbi:putative glycosyltransferase EpsE [compost metagenome]